MHFFLCFFGLFRAVNYTIGSIDKHIFSQFGMSNHTFSVFIHTYNVKSYSNYRSGEGLVPVNITAQVELLKSHADEARAASSYKGCRERIFSPAFDDYTFIEEHSIVDKTISSDMDEYLRFGNPWKETDPTNTSLLNSLRALHSLQHLNSVIEERQENANKDIGGIVFLRPDVQFLTPLPLEISQHPLFHCKTAFLPDFHRSCEGGEVNDRFFMGSLKAALTWSSRMQSAKEYAHRKPLHSETFLHDHLREMGTVVVEIPMRFKRILAHGEAAARDESLPSPYEQLRKSFLGTKPSTGFAREIYMKLIYGRNLDDPHHIYCNLSPNRVDVQQFARYLSTKSRGGYEKALRDSLFTKET